MKGKRKVLEVAVTSSLIVSLLALSGCNKPASTGTDNAASAASAASAAQPASAANAYTPPTAEQLEQMVAPIALFPDKLVAQVLAGATYPDQITAANQWLAQNPSLKGEALQNAANAQPWDVSVKSLTAFPAVLSQMAGNIQWTTALGEAYAYDPADVMNAIQVMRLKAQAAGNLKTSQQLKVTSVASSAPPPQTYSNDPDEPDVYEGPAVVPPPPQTIEIEPAQPDVVYVPTYNPADVYGAPVPVYPGYAYSRPAYSTGDVVAAGVISFGVGIIVGSAISHHHDWGWHSWGMNWHGEQGSGGGWHRPAVVYNHSTYVTKSTTVVNRITNVHNTRITNNYGATNNRFVHNNTVNNNPGRPNFGAGPANPDRAREQAHSGPMTMPHFTRNDMREGARPAPAPEGQRPGQPPHPGAPHANFAAEGQRPGNAAGPAGRPGPAHQQAGQAGRPNEAQRSQNEAAMAQRNEQREQEQRQQQQRQQQEQGQQQRQQQEQQQRQQQQRQQQEQQHQQQQRQQQAETQRRPAEMAQQHAAQQARQAPRPQPRPQMQPHPQQRAQPHPQPHPQPHGGGQHEEHRR